MAGFGPANTGVKVLCLRPAWRHLSGWWIGDYGHPSGPWYELYHLSHAVQYEGYWVGFFISQPVFTGSQRPYPNLFFTSSEPVVNLAAILLVILPLIACKLTSNIVYLCFFTQTQMACTRMFHKRLVSPLFYTAPCNHFGTETHTVTHIGLGLSDSSFRTPGRTWTCDPLLRRQTLYPTELRVRNIKLYFI